MKVSNIGYYFLIYFIYFIYIQHVPVFVRKILLAYSISKNMIKNVICPRF